MLPHISGSQSSAGRQPGAPTSPSATAGNTQATVTFTAPTYLGKPSTNNLYTVTSSPGGITGTGTSSPITVTGLTNGTAYTFTITLRTRNSDNSVIAISLPSVSSNSVTPVAPTPQPVPQAPQPVPQAPVPQAPQPQPQPVPQAPQPQPQPVPQAPQPVPQPVPQAPQPVPQPVPQAPQPVSQPYTICTSADVDILCCYTTGCNTGPQFCSSGGGCSSGSNLCYNPDGCY